MGESPRHLYKASVSCTQNLLSGSSPPSFPRETFTRAVRHKLSEQLNRKGLRFVELQSLRQLPPHSPRSECMLGLESELLSCRRNTGLCATHNEETGHRAGIPKAWREPVQAWLNVRENNRNYTDVICILPPIPPAVCETDSRIIPRRDNLYNSQWTYSGC